MAEEFSKRIGEVINTSSIGLLLALAKETGVLTALKEASKPLTSKEIADLKDLKERYVREILGCLACAKFVGLQTSESGENVYVLSEEEKQGYDHGITWPFLSLIRVMGSAFGRIRNVCDAKGPYGSHYTDDAQSFMEALSLTTREPQISSMLTNIPGLKDRLESGIDVIEFGCGSGQMLATLATRFPNSRFTASELIPELVEKLRAKFGHLPNMSFEIRDLCRLKDTVEKKYDLAYSIDVIHDLPKPQEALDNIRRLLKEENGVYALVEPCTTESGSLAEGVGNMNVAAFYGLSTFMCVPEGFQEKESVAMGMCVGKKPMVDAMTKARFSVKDFNLDGPFSLYVCNPI